MAEPSAPSIEAQFKDWQFVYLRELHEQVALMHHHRELFRRAIELLHQTPSNDTIFSGFLASVYADSQVLAVRRIVDGDTRAVSFRRLIGQMLDHRKDVTRDWYVERRLRFRGEVDADLVEADATQVFNHLIDRPHHDHLGGRWLGQDLRDLKAVTERVAAFADKYVAHRDRDPGDVAATFGDLDECIDHLGPLLSRYSLFIRGVALVQVTPVVQGDWEQPLREIGGLPQPWGGGSGQLLAPADET